jgi:surface antigen
MDRMDSLRYGMVVAAIAGSLAVGGCATTDKEDMGTFLGGVLGAVVGHKIDDGGTGGIVLGTLVGALAGKMIGQYMDKSDREQLAKTLNETPKGQEMHWQNKTSGNDFRVVPTSNYYDKGGKQCRTFTQAVTVDGQQQEMQGVACRSPGSDELAIEDLQA